jgi:anthranilate/para-aminobenzoate synthase component II
VTTDGKTIFHGINRPFPAMRYHSLAVERESLPECFEISAVADDGEIMGIRHRVYPIEGIQFHPESIGTPVGKRILRNFKEMITNGEQKVSVLGA